MEKYKLQGIDGNAFFVMGYVVKCMKKENKTQQEIDTYEKEAMSGDYSKLLGISMDVIDSLNESLKE
jgi:hypothetical protein